MQVDLYNGRKMVVVVVIKMVIVVVVKMVVVVLLPLEL